MTIQQLDSIIDNLTDQGDWLIRLLADIEAAPNPAPAKADDHAADTHRGGAR